MPRTEDWLEKADNVLGSKGISIDPDEMSPWLTDWRGRYTGKAAALLSPASTSGSGSYCENRL